MSKRLLAFSFKIFIPGKAENVRQGSNRARSDTISSGFDR